MPLEELSIGPAGVPLDLAPLAEHPTLTSIDLGGTPIASARPLLSCPGLKKVGLWGTKVDLGELRQLKDCLEARGGRLSHHRPEF